MQITDKEESPWGSFADPGGAGTGPITAGWNYAATRTYDALDHAGVIRHTWTGAPGATVTGAVLEKLFGEAGKGGRKPG